MHTQIIGFSVSFRSYLLKASLRGLGILIVASFFGCALPSEEPSQHFVERADLRAVSLAREGIFFLSQNRFIDAELKLLQALRLKPHAENLKLNLVSVFEGEERYDEAYQTLKPIVDKYALTDDPLKVDTLFRLGHLSASARKFGEAEEAYKKIVTLAEGKSDFVLAAKAARNLKILAFKQGKLQDALCYAGMVASYANDLVSLFEYASMLLALDHNDQVVELLTQYGVANNRAHDPRLLHLTAFAQLGMGKFSEAWQNAELVNRETKLDVGIARENDLIRVLSATEPQIAKTLTESQIDELAESWDTLGGGISFEASEVLAWPRRFLEMLENKLVTTPPEEN